MKATFQIPDALYRELKTEAARDGLTMREVAIGLFDQWLRQKKQISPVTPAVDWLNFTAPLAHLVAEDMTKYNTEDMRKSITEHWDEQA